MVCNFLIWIKKHETSTKNYTVQLDNITILAAHENDFWQKRGQAMCFGNYENVVEVFGLISFNNLMHNSSTHE